MERLELGLCKEVEITVNQDMTASSLKSGGIDVLSTPYMIALMENAALNAVQPYLEEGKSTVGTQVNISHIAATAVGKKVMAKAKLNAIDGRKLTFDIEAFMYNGNEEIKIGYGTHERFIIDIKKFMSKL